MSKLLVMTDLHLTVEPERIIGLNPLDRFTMGLKHAAEHHPDAERLILTGDLTHYGQAEAYQSLKSALSPMPWPVSFLLGNHDNRAVFREVFPEVPTDSSGFIQSAVDLADVRLITLDTLEEGIEPKHAGRLCPARLEWFEEQLAASNEKPCLVFLHHPPFLTGFNGMDRIRLLDDDAFLKIARCGPVAHVFAGHIHRTITATVDGLSVTVFKSPCHQMPMKLGEDGSGHSADEPGAYGIVLTNGADITVHFEDFTLPEHTMGNA